MSGPENIGPSWLPLSWLSVAVLVGSLLGTWWASSALRRLGIRERYAWSLYPYAMLGGVAGAKLWAAFEISLGPDGRSFADVLFSRVGATFYGGLALGAIAVAGKIAYDGMSLRLVTSALAPTLALSQAIGRIGCFLVGDDYGVPTSLPWGTAFPHGIPPTTEVVHPTQLYEAAWLFLCAGILRRRLKASRLLIAEYLVAQGAGRFLIEFIRTNPHTLGFMTTSQVTAAICVAVGLFCLSSSYEKGGDEACM